MQIARRDLHVLRSTCAKSTDTRIEHRRTDGPALMRGRDIDGFIGRPVHVEMCGRMRARVCVKVLGKYKRIGGVTVMCALGGRFD